MYSRTGGEILPYSKQGKGEGLLYPAQRMEGKDFFILHKEWRGRPYIFYTRSQLVGALSPVNHRGLYQGYSTKGQEGKTLYILQKDGRKRTYMFYTRLVS